MGRIIYRNIERAILAIAAIACLSMTIINLSNVQFDTYGTIYIVDEYVDTYYEVLSDNVGLTTINGISNVYYNMKRDGYSIYKEDISNTHVDVSFVKEGAPSYRYYYEHSKGKITFFSSDYESSYTGISYIIEKKD